MLAELTIKNFAIIDKLTITFAPGLNIVTGETGAGKSIIIGAIALILGDRAATDLIRTGAEVAEVEALFQLREGEGRISVLEEWGMDAGEEILIKRVIARSGKGRAYVNGHVVTLAMLTRLGEELVSLCGQHEHERLLVPEHHLEFLDTYEGLMPTLQVYKELYQDVQALDARIAATREELRNREQTRELFSFQLREIEDVNPQVGEDVALEEERRILVNSRRLQELALGAYDGLYAGEKAALPRIKAVLEDVAEIKKIDPHLPVVSEELEGLYYQLEDLAFTLRDYGHRLPVDLGRLGEIDDRWERLSRLKKKYGGTIAAVIARREAILSALAEAETVTEELAWWEEERSEKYARLERQAQELSERRRAGAKRLAEDLTAELATLMMPGARFHVAITETSLTEQGRDKVEFLFSANLGEEVKPLHRVASGGELSRLILSLKKVLTDRGEEGTIIFDEVDSGIGGATAVVVGEKIEEVSRYHQVICITHLSQIAQFGRQHYRVEKQVRDGKTVTRVKALTEEERHYELARMLGGKTISGAAWRYAAELLAGKTGQDGA